MKLITTILAAALAIAGSLSAQSIDRINVKFPSPVIVNGATIPAGDATIQVIHGTGTVMLAIRSESGPSATVLVDREEDEADRSEPQVILDHKGNDYLFNRLVLPDHTAYQVLNPSN
jgi:hypothetical protein